MWSGSLQLPHRHNFFAGGGPEEVDAEMPEVGVVVGVWGLCQEEGEALGTHDHGHSHIVSYKHTCLSWVKPWGGMTGGNEYDDGTQSRSANTTIDSSSVSDAYWTVTAPGEELAKRKCW